MYIILREIERFGPYICSRLSHSMNVIRMIGGRLEEDELVGIAECDVLGEVVFRAGDSDPFCSCGA